MPLAVALAFLAGCGNGEDSAAGGPPQAPAQIQVTQVGERSYADQVEALGTVRAFEATEVSSNVTERVAEVHFEDGDEVKAGAVLVRLDDAEEEAIKKAAEAELAEQEREIKRLEKLVEQGAVSEVRLQEFFTQRDVALARIAEAQAQIQDRSIRAPFDGVLGFRQVSVGAMLTPSDVITTLDVLDPVKLDFTVPETFLSDLRPGLEIEAQSIAFPGESFSGEVTQVDTRVNPITRSVTVRAKVPNPDKRLRPGMLMTTVLEKNPQKSLSIPERCVVSVQAQHFVFVVQNPQDDAPTVNRVQVQLGRRLPGYVEILGGLEKGLTIVTDGLIGLVDGGAVKITGEFTKPADPYQPEA